MQQKIEHFFSKVEHQKSFFLKMFLCIFCGGYALFLTSNIWLPINSDMIAATPLNKIQSWQNREVQILSWNYAKEQNEMEIILELDNKSMDGIKNYSYEILDRKKGYFEIQPIVESNDLIVLSVTDIKKGWSELSLRITIPTENTGDNNTLKLYTNKNEVAKVKSIQVQTENQYRLDRIDLKIVDYKYQIETLSSENEELKEQITNLETGISEYKEKERYQTLEQINETERIIQAAQSDIANLQSNIEQNKNRIDEYAERITKLEEERNLYNQ